VLYADRCSDTSAQNLWRLAQQGPVARLVDFTKGWEAAGPFFLQSYRRRRGRAGKKGFLAVGVVRERGKGGAPNILGLARATQCIFERGAEWVTRGYTEERTGRKDHGASASIGLRWPKVDRLMFPRRDGAIPRLKVPFGRERADVWGRRAGIGACHRRNRETANRAKGNSPRRYALEGRRFCGRGGFLAGPIWWGVGSERGGKARSSAGVNGRARRAVKHYAPQPGRVRLFGRRDTGVGEGLALSPSNLGGRSMPFIDPARRVNGDSCRAQTNGPILALKSSTPGGDTGNHVGGGNIGGTPGNNKGSPGNKKPRRHRTFGAVLFGAGYPGTSGFNRGGPMGPRRVRGRAGGPPGGSRARRPGGVGIRVSPMPAQTGGNPGGGRGRLFLGDSRGAKEGGRGQGTCLRGKCLWTGGANPNWFNGGRLWGGGPQIVFFHLEGRGRGVGGRQTFYGRLRAKTGPGAGSRRGGGTRWASRTRFCCRWKGEGGGGGGSRGFIGGVGGIRFPFPSGEIPRDFFENSQGADKFGIRGARPVLWEGGSGRGEGGKGASGWPAGNFSGKSGIRSWLAEPAGR